MVGSEHEPIQLRLIVGRGDRATFRLDVSTKPLSVGTQGDWIVTAEGVGPIHFFLAFDGSHVYVTPASQAHTVLLGGVPLGAGWTVAAVPSELRFAGARVALERAWPNVVPAEGQSMGMSTVSDGGALWDAARRALQDIPVEPEEAMKPAAGRPFDGAFDGTQKPAPPPEATRDAGFGSTLTMERNSSPLARRISVPPSGGATMTAVGGLGDGASELPTTLPGMESRKPSAPPSSNGEPSTRKGAWQEASTVQKIIVVLMPFAIAAAYQMEFHPARGQRAASAPTPQATAAPPLATVVTPPESTARDVAAVVPVDATASRVTDATASRAVDATASRVTDATASPGKAPSRPGRAVATATARPGGSSSKPQGLRTAERAALDAVAAGAYADAARDYDALAAAHPEDTSFKDAARILHDKATRGR